MDHANLSQFVLLLQSAAYVRRSVFSSGAVAAE